MQSSTMLCFGEMQAEQIADRFWSKVEISPSCWMWMGKLDRHGYGKFSITHDKHVFAHRLAFELMRSVIPNGLELDHLCRNPKCVNPDHLRIVTHLENMRAQFHANSKKTHCPKGHPYSGVNSFGFRICRICRDEQHRKSRRPAPSVFL